MAFETGHVGAALPGPPRTRFEWWIDHQNEDGNYTVIGWRVFAVGGSNGYWVENFASLVDVHGARRHTGGHFRMYQGQQFASGHVHIGHDGNGNAGFGAHVNNQIYYRSWNSAGSNSYGLPGLYQDINFHSITVNNETDIGFQVHVHVDRGSNLLQLSINGSDWVTYQEGGSWGAHGVQVGGTGGNSLRSGETYSVRVRVRRASNGRLKESGTYWIATKPQGGFFNVGDF